MANKQKQKLIVMFDTNVLFTQVASDLVRHDVKRIIKENSNHPDLVIEWHIPEVVVGERKYQMMGKATELLPNMHKLEKLLGSQFAIGEESLELHVDNAIKKNINECGFQITSVNTNEIDWNNIISRSCRREPPFEAGEKEKGFRDAIIAHSFLGLHKLSPTTPSLCRLALISNDERLQEYVLEKTTSSKNIRMLSSLEELESLINTLVSTIPEDFAAELTKKAEKLFFDPDNNKGLYYKEKIPEKIKEKHSKELSNTFIPGAIRNNGTWWISAPVFIKKNKQRIHWSSTVSPEFEIFHYENNPLYQNSLLTAGLNPPVPPPPPTPYLGLGQPRQSGLVAQALQQKKIVDIKGKEKFEVHWTTNLSQAQNLTAAKIEKIQYIGNDLAESS